MLTFLHPLVDFCSVAVLAAGGITFERWLVYNALAFALQLPMGMAMDGLMGWRLRTQGEVTLSTGDGRGLEFALVAGCLLVAAGAIAAVGGFAGWLPLCVACVGNAIFHLTAGASVLDGSPGKSGPIGLFISTGALGLMAGQMAAGGGGQGLTAIPIVAVVLVAGATWWGTGRGRPVHDGGGSVKGIAGRGRPVCEWLVAVLLALVVWRSWAGLLAGRMSSGEGIAFVLAGAFVTWAGKAAGGYLADWRGRGIVVVVSAVGSAALCFACSPSNAVAWLVLLFVAQLATGPVLSLMYDKCGGRAGTSFGLNCFGLFAGSIV